MPPNVNEYPAPSEVNFAGNSKDGFPEASTPTSPGGPAAIGQSSGFNTVLKTVRSITTLLAHFMIGIIVGVTVLFAFRGETIPTTRMNQHIILCVIGFHFLMAESILSLAPDSWLSTLNLKHKRWVHSVMQILGSTMALTGCFIIIVERPVHWVSIHGQFALVSMVFTTVSLVNGVTSLYAYNFRRVIPGILSRLTHICFGIMAMVAASVSLADAFTKNSFRNWTSTQWEPMPNVMIVMTAVMTTIVVINPFITFFNKFVGHFKKN